MRTIYISLGFSFFASLYGARRPGTVWGTCLARVAEQTAVLGGGGAVRGWWGRRAGSSNDPLRSPQLRLDSFMPRGACAGLSCHLRPWPGRLYLISPGARPKRALGPPGHLDTRGESVRDAREKPRSAERIRGQEAEAVLGL